MLLIVSTNSIADDAEQKAILVTGASTGIGLKITEVLSEIGAKLQRETDAEQGKERTEVADAVLHFMSSDKPKHRCMVTPNERQAKVTIKQAMSEMLQLNYDQAYTYSREELVDMLDQVLSEL